MNYSKRSMCEWDYMDAPREKCETCGKYIERHRQKRGLKDCWLCYQTGRPKDLPEKSCEKCNEILEVDRQQDGKSLCRICETEEKEPWITTVEPKKEGQEERRRISGSSGEWRGRRYVCADCCDAGGCSSCTYMAPGYVRAGIYVPAKGTHQAHYEYAKKVENVWYNDPSPYDSFAHLPLHFEVGMGFDTTGDLTLSPAILQNLHEHAKNFAKNRNRPNNN